MKKLTLLVPIIILAACATLNPKADPFVVRVEQTQSVASATFDAVLRLDNTDRSFWMSNAPAFHRFCEWGRTPMAHISGIRPRFVVMQLNVDDLKTAYKNEKSAGNSNKLFLSLSVLKDALNQANSWSNVITAPIH